MELIRQGLSLIRFNAYDYQKQDFLHVLRDIRSLIPQNHKLLDIGCYEGDETLDYARILDTQPGNIFGVDCFEENISQCLEKGINASPCDIESNSLPFPSNYFDIVTCNQVFEHLKNIFLPMTEIHRVLKCGGRLIFSVPNLAAFHNRLLLLFGKQPTCIHVVGPHIRGYTNKELTSFLTAFDLFRLIRIRGSGMYPFPRWIAETLASLFPGYALYSIILLKKTRNAEEYTWMNLVGQSLPRNVTKFTEANHEV